MRISIVTVAFNSAATIADTLRSVEEQTHPDIEHVVIDGGSSDGTPEIVRDMGRRVSTFVSEPDGGIYFGMNKGLARCTGDVVGFLNSDDFFASPGAVARIVDEFGRGAADVVHGDLVYVRREKPDSVVRYWKASPFVPGAFSTAWCPAHPTFYARRAVIQRTGGFNTTYRVAADLELMLRILEVQRSPSSMIPEILVRMRVGGVSNSSLRGIYRQNVEVMRAIRSNGLAVNPVIFAATKAFRRAAQFISLERTSQP
jgi:glycosyltransferase involved in cell wall biosynthesis